MWTLVIDDLFGFRGIKPVTVIEMWKLSVITAPVHHRDDGLETHHSEAKTDRLWLSKFVHHLNCTTKDSTVITAGEAV